MLVSSITLPSLSFNTTHSSTLIFLLCFFIPSPISWTTFVISLMSIFFPFLESTSSNYNSIVSGSKVINFSWDLYPFLACFTILYPFFNFYIILLSFSSGSSTFYYSTTISNFGRISLIFGSSGYRTFSKFNRFCDCSLSLLTISFFEFSKFFKDSSWIKIAGLWNAYLSLSVILFSKSSLWGIVSCTFSSSDSSSLT